MTNPRWWDAAAIAVAAVLVALTLVDPPYGPPDRVVWAAAAAFLVWYAAAVRGLLPQAAPVRYWVATSGFAIVLFIGCSAEPSFALMQGFVYPLVWVVAPSTRSAIGANILVALSVALGYVVRFGVVGIAVGFGTAALSLAGSIALGLWITRIAQYGDERARLLDELQAVQGELAVLHREAGVTGERARLAREIHDTIAQSLTGLVMVAQRAGNRLAPGATPDLDGTRDDVQLMEEMARDALTDARGLVAALAPVDVAQGLDDALARLAAAFERETGVAVTVEAHHGALDRELEVVLLRAAQEGLANVRKHANAGRAAITVTDAANGSDEIVLAVADDGVGPSDAERFPHGFGLSGLRDRLALVGGAVAFGAASGGGTVLRVTAPRARATGIEAPS